MFVIGIDTVAIHPVRTRQPLCHQLARVSTSGFGEGKFVDGVDGVDGVDDGGGLFGGPRFEVFVKNFFGTQEVHDAVAWVVAR